MSNFSIGSRVKWTSSGAGVQRPKIGFIREVVPVGVVPSGIREPGAARDHVSYLVRSDAGRLYWPRVNKLEDATTALRVWWIPQVPGKPFHVPVKDIEQAKLVLDTLGRYDAFQLEHNIKPDYSNVGGLEAFEGNEWIEWHNEDGDDIDAVMSASPEPAP